MTVFFSVYTGEVVRMILFVVECKEPIFPKLDCLKESVSDGYRDIEVIKLSVV